MNSLRALIVNDSHWQKRVLARAVESTNLGNVAKIASNTAIALERLTQAEIDVVFLKVPLAEENVSEFINIIIKDYPQISLIITYTNAKMIQNIDVQDSEPSRLAYLSVPEEEPTDIANLRSTIHDLFTEIITKYYTNNIFPRKVMLDRLLIEDTQKLPKVTLVPQAESERSFSNADLILIAASTGGPAALESIVSRLPYSLNKPILIVQHTLPELTKNMANSLNKKSALPVIEGKDEDLIKPGQIILAPGGKHMLVEKRGIDRFVRLESNTSPVNGVRPSADVLFESVVEAYKESWILAIILTGMGKDGTFGVKMLKEKCRTYCLVQSEKTCVVYGMPKSIVEADLADAVEDLPNIPAKIIELSSERNWRQ